MDADRQVGSVVRLKTALDAENLRSPIRTSRSGRRSGGNPMSRGHLYWILSNPIYVGRLRHKGQIYDGLHPAIVDLETWDRVRQKLESQTRARRISQPDDHSFLAGKLYDDRGNRMSASHASKDGRRWRYHVSRAALTGRKQDAGSVVRISASKIESPDRSRGRGAFGDSGKHDRRTVASTKAFLAATTRSRSMAKLAVCEWTRRPRRTCETRSSAPRSARRGSKSF